MECHKAFIRGILIQIGARERRRRTQHLDSLTAEIKSLENLNQTQPDRALKHKLGLLRQELRSHLLDSYEKAHTRFGAKHYSTGNKAGKAMAARIKGHYAKTKIAHIYHPASKQKLVDPSAIAEAFRHYYNTLYNLKEDSSVPQPSPQDISAFLEHINLPRLSSDQLLTLNTPFTPPELLETISKLPSNKSPGPDDSLVSTTNSLDKH